MNIWSNEETNKLIELNNQRLSDTQIGKIMNKTNSAIEHKRRQLGITKLLTSPYLTDTNKEITTVVDKNNRKELYVQVFEIINNSIETYTCGLKPVKCLINYTKKKKVEIANAIISDMHIGKLNKVYYPPLQKEIITYNDEIRTGMLQRYLNSIAEIVSMQMNCYYFEKLNLFLLGDLIDGDGYVFEGQEFKVTKIAGQQLWDAVRDFSFLINELTKLFPKIEVFCLVGNHSMATTNRKMDLPIENYLEFHIYTAMKKIFEAEKNNKVIFTIPTSRYYSTKVYNHLFYMSHGDESGGGAKTTRIRKAKDVYINLPNEKYDVYMMGHVHSLEKDPIGDKGTLLTNGAWIPFDDYARKLYGIYTEPKQWFFSTNRVRPITLAFELDFKGVQLTEGLKL